MISPNPFDKKKYPYCHAGHKYAQDIVGLKIPACKYVIGACNRYFNDLIRAKDKSNTFYFDSEYAERYLRIVQNFEHVKGKWKTDKIVYQPWQLWIWMNIMGWKNRVDDRRRIRVAHVEIPRGNAKSAMASQCSLFFLALDDPKGNEISTFATKTEQARIVLDSARSMAKKSKSYLKKTGVKVLAHQITHPASESKMRAMAADGKTLDGLNDILAVLDELHAMNRVIFDVISSGMSKRNDSLLLCITTAGFDTDSVGADQSAYVKKLCSGEIQDDQMFGVVYTIDEGDDIFEETSWIKANPGWGDSVDPVTFRAKAQKAKEVPADQPSFKVKHLNQWISEARAYFDLEAFDKCANPNLKLEDFKGQKAILAMDMASKIDLTSLSLIFRKEILNSDGQKVFKYTLFDDSFIPEERAKKVKSTLYDNAIGNGYLTATKGSAIHYPFIKERILRYKNDFQIIAIPYDPWSATEIAQTLTQEGLELLEFRQNTSNLSEPTKRLDALFREGLCEHNGSPILRWAIGNVVCKEDANSNIFPRKSHEKLKIDPAIAAIMGLAVWIQEDNTGSVYEQQGIDFF